MQPILQWAGGKRQLLPALTRPPIPLADDGRYYEPFIGGGALLFDQAPARATIGDTNKDLVTLYNVVRDDCQDLIDLVAGYPNNKEFFLKIRGLDRDKSFDELPAIERAARALYLNRACFNGVYRVNRKGQFNNSYGYYKDLNFEFDNVRAVSDYLQNNDVLVMHGGYADTLAAAGPGDFVYLDPPYDPVTKGSFTRYAAGGFNRNDHEALYQQCIELDRRGVKFLLSNSDTAFTRGLYAGFTVETVTARRSINPTAAHHRTANEILVSNYR